MLQYSPRKEPILPAASGLPVERGVFVYITLCVKVVKKIYGIEHSLGIGAVIIFAAFVLHIIARISVVNIRYAVEVFRFETDRKTESAGLCISVRIAVSEILHKLEIFPEVFGEMLLKVIFRKRDTVIGEIIFKPIRPYPHKRTIFEKVGKERKPVQFAVYACGV